MKKLVLTLLCMLAMSLCASAQQPTSNPTPAEVLRTVRCVLDKKCASWVSRKDYDSESAQVVFIKDGKRYTVYVVLETKPVSAIASELKGYVSFWVRPDGTYDQKSLETFTTNLAGLAYFGIAGNDLRKYYHDKREGLEWQNSWQILANESFKNLRSHIGQ